MPTESDQATTNELEAELAKLTDELESECAHLEADEDRPIGTTVASSEPAAAESSSPEPSPEAPRDPAESADTASIDAIAQAVVDEDAGAVASDAPPPQPEPADKDLEDALGALIDETDLDSTPTDGWSTGEAEDAPPIDLGVVSQTDDSEPEAAKPESEELESPRGWEPPDAVDQVEAIDRSLADLTAQLMDEGGGDASNASSPSSSEQPTASDKPEIGTASAATRAKAAATVAMARAAPVARAAATYASIATRHTVRVAGPPARAAGLKAARTAAPLGARALLLMSKPVSNRPETVRSSMGWLAAGTLFIASVTWFFVLIRTPSAPVPTETPASISADGAPPSPANGPAQTAGSSAESSGSGT